MPETLFELPPSPPPAPRRVSSKGIAPGDVVEIDKKGRRFHALVKSIEQDPKGYFHLDLHPGLPAVGGGAVARAVRFDLH